MRIMIGTFPQVSLSHNPMNAGDSCKVQTAVTKDIKKAKATELSTSRRPRQLQTGTEYWQTR